MAGEITRELLEEAFERMRADLGKPPARQMIYCHPIDEPFLTVLYSGKLRTTQLLNRWIYLRRECLRKLRIAHKQTRYDWSSTALANQYRKKLEELVR